MKRATLDYINGIRDDRFSICGIRIIGTDRDIYRNVTTFVFENGWEIPVNVGCFDGLTEPEEIVRFLVREVEMRLHFLDPMQLEAFNAPETLPDEDPDELDPFPVFVCQRCRDDYRP